MIISQMYKGNLDDSPAQANALPCLGSQSVAPLQCSYLRAWRAGTQARYEAAEEQLQHLQAAADSVLTELESTRRAINGSAGSLGQPPPGRSALASLLLQQLPDSSLP